MPPRMPWRRWRWRRDLAPGRGPDRLCGAALAVVDVAMRQYDAALLPAGNSELEHVHRFDADGVCGCGASACGRCRGRGWVPPYGVSLPAGFDPSEHGGRCPGCDGEGA